MNNDDLVKGNRQFIQQTRDQNPDFFNQLKEGQQPHTFLLACCDSRVDPSVITKMPLGSLFVHRNIANQASEEDTSFTASLTYALKHLKVKQIVINGHTGCGGIAAAWKGIEDPELQGWVGEIRKHLPNPKENPDLTPEALSRINVLKQMEQLKKHPVYLQYGAGVDIIGYLFHLESGELEKL